VDEERATPNSEPLLTSLFLLPARAAFVAVAVVQIAVEFAVAAFASARTSRDDAPTA
jgi:hypothetical protein